MPHIPSTWVTLALSTLAHGALAGIVVGHGFPAGSAPAARVVPLELQLVDAPAPVETEKAEQPAEALKSFAKPGAPAPHHHPYPVPFDHDATPHDPNLVHAPLPVVHAVPQAMTEEPSAPPMFVLGPSPALVARGSAAPSNANGAAPRSGAAEVVGEREVSVPAQLVARGPLVYPPDARRAEVEADVPVEIVVDEAGRVVSARALARASHGLDSAAVESMHAYRFTPARRDGRTVRVRMRWIVGFHLD